MTRNLTSPMTTKVFKTLYQTGYVLKGSNFVKEEFVSRQKAMTYAQYGDFVEKLGFNSYIINYLCLYTELFDITHTKVIFRIALSSNKENSTKCNFAVLRHKRYGYRNVTVHKKLSHFS